MRKWIDRFGMLTAFIGLLIVKLGMMVIKDSGMRMEFIKFFAEIGETAQQTIRKEKGKVTNLHNVTVYYTNQRSAFDVLLDMYTTFGRESIEQALEEIHETKQKEENSWRYST